MMILFTYMAVTMYLVQICSQRGFYLQLLNISKFDPGPEGGQDAPVTVRHGRAGLCGRELRLGGEGER